ncbi:MAG: hypothetical protein K2X74_00310 [Acetobacteraceae bacterium]|nr:hypothetical protein [Acetobacteraceae bacterium]
MRSLTLIIAASATLAACTYVERTPAPTVVQTPPAVVAAPPAAVVAPAPTVTVRPAY